VRLECSLIQIAPFATEKGFFAFSSTEPPIVRESKVTVKIPRPLYRKIQQVVDGSGFNSPTDFIVYVLRDLMGEADEKTEPDFSQEELDDVKRKLKNLGYL
jgi:Arc/MetJ-type ribon-helix-helix transcriptional regulator